MSHTPGPWRANTVGPEERNLDGVSIRDEQHGHRVAEAYGSANAILIAAAPELLEALEAIRDEVSGSYGGWAKDALSATFIRDIARAAIAKAKGEAK